MGGTSTSPAQLNKYRKDLHTGKGGLEGIWNGAALGTQFRWARTEILQLKSDGHHAEA